MTTRDERADLARPGPGGPAIELVDVVKHFGAAAHAAAVRGVSLTIAEGEFFSLLGPSGCGKTTTLRMIGGFEEPTSGAIRLHGVDMVGTPPNRRDVNMVFQSYALFPHLSVFENVAFGLRRRGVAKDEIRARVHQMLEVVELTDRAESRPRQLSGGQQQRVALARALVNRPRALLLDEPLGALDLKLRQSMQLELGRIQREVGITFIYVTHDQSEALTMSDRIAVMNGGLIEQVGSPVDVYERPMTVFVAGFIGTSNVIRARLATAAAGIGTIDLGGDGHVAVPLREDMRLAAGAEVNVTVRPEKIRLSRERGEGDCWLRGTVSELVYQGTATSCTVRTPGGQSIVVFRQNDAHDAAARQGDEVWLSWSTAHTYLLTERPAGALESPAPDPAPSTPTAPSLT